MGKENTIFIEARLKEARPYICGSVSNPEVHRECVNQPLMIVLKRRGQTWSGSFPIKHYWDKYAGEGEDRRVVGTQITATELSFTLKPAPASP